MDVLVMGEMTPIKVKESNKVSSPNRIKNPVLP